MKGRLPALSSVPRDKQYLSALEAIIRKSDSKFGKPYFEAMVLQLAEALGAEVAFIGETIQGGRAVQTIAMAAGGRLTDNCDYALADTPCANVVAQKLCAYPSGVQQAFPKDFLLKQMEIEGYIGVPLFDFNRKPIGIMVALYRHPIPDPRFAKAVLSIFAGRTGVEMGRRRVEAALRESEERYRRIVNTQTEVISRSRPDTTLTFVNDAYCRFFGVEPAEVVGKSFLRFVREEYRDKVREHIESLVKRPRVQRVQHQVLTAGGQLRWQEWVDVPVRDASGRVVEFQSVGRDITEQKEAEQALYESEERFRSLANASFEGVAISEQGRVLHVNNRFAEMFGYDPDELRGMPVEKMVAPEHRELVRLRIQTDYDRPYEHRALRKDNSIIEVEACGRSILYKGRKCRITAVRDVTEQKKMNRRLREAGLREQQRIGRDLHDGLGQHLTALAFQAKRLEQKLTGRSAEAAQEAAKIMRLANDSVSQARKLAKGLCPLDGKSLGELLTALAAEARSLHRVACSARCTVIVPTENLYAETQLYRITQEALNNALRHGRATKVAIDLRRRGPFLVLIVRDNGTGFPKKVPLSSQGMGLRTMNYRAITLDGVLTVRSARGGKGTVVTCIVPWPEKAV